MAIELTLAKAQELIQSAIDDRGADYVYPKSSTGACTYVDIGYQGEDNERTFEKGCIVGHAFISALDLDVEEIADKYVNDEGAASFLAWLVEYNYVTKTHIDALDYIERVQRNQDAGRQWGEANEQALLGKVWVKSYEAYMED